jgi:hypothetical protein
MKRILINETEKNEILNQHKDFKKILEEKKVNLDKGLMIEQRAQEPIFLDKFTMSQVISKCVTNPNVRAETITFKGKPAIRVNSGPDNVKIYTNEPNTSFGGYNYYILNTDENKILKGPMSWKCSKLYADEDAQAAAAKKAEEDKKRAEQEGMTKRQKEFTDGLVAQGYVINPSEWDITSKRLRKYDNSKIPGLLDIFKNGLNVYYDPTTIKLSDNSAYSQRADSMSKDVNSCKDLVEKFWEDYQQGGEGDLQDTLFYKLRSDVQSCVNKWYPKWDGLEGGALGIGTGQNHLNNIIDVLTGKKTEYKGSQIPSRTTGYLLTPPRKSR